jgi:hypothetical protein
MDSSRSTAWRVGAVRDLVVGSDSHDVVATANANESVYAPTRLSIDMVPVMTGLR